MEAAMTRHFKGALLGAVLASAASAAWAHHATMMPVNIPMLAGDVSTVCTGIGLDAREDPRWKDYPLRIEIAGKEGQYLGDAVVEITGGELNEELALRCSGPWVLVDVPAGRYDVTVHAGHEGPLKHAKVTVGDTQKRLVMHFPNMGGETTQMIAVAY
jgi:hypothetical protein